MRFALRILDADDQHVLGEPAFYACLPARDAQRMAFLAKERVAAVTRAETHDRELLGKMHDEAALGIEIARRVQSLDEAPFARDALEGGAAHAGHHLHVDDDVSAVRDLDAAARTRRVDRSHAIRHDVKRAALHRAAEQVVHALVRFAGIHPVIVGARVFAIARADEGQVFDARDVRGM